MVIRVGRSMFLANLPLPGFLGGCFPVGCWISPGHIVSFGL